MYYDLDEGAGVGVGRTGTLAIGNKDKLNSSWASGLGVVEGIVVARGSRKHRTGDRN
jgi:hypothetical protein